VAISDRQHEEQQHLAQAFDQVADDLGEADDVDAHAFASYLARISSSRSEKRR
jgi:hypothetical protein